MENLDIVNDEFVEQEIEYILKGENSPNIITVGEESVVLLNVYEELEKELQQQKDRYKKCIFKKYIGNKL